MTAGIPTLYLIDGYAQFYRAYHAIRTPMTSPVTKEPTNLTFGFVGMLLKTLRGEGMDAPPEYLAVAMDVSGDRGTFRSQMYPEYKANRPPPPEDMHVQVRRCLAILEDLGVPTIGSPGFEADDVIATIVDRTAEQPDLRVRLISKDKDLKQLLEPRRVEMFDVHTGVLYDAATLKEETGLEPGQVVDMLALMGDTSDNIPGVDGVGAKTAAQLIAAHGTLDDLMAHADDIKGKRGEKIRAAADRLPDNVRLVTLERRTPIEFDLDACRIADLHLERLRPTLRELGFNRFQDELDELLGGAPDQPSTPARTSAPAPMGDSLFGHLEDADDGGPPVVDGDYTCITTKAQLDALVAMLSEAPLISVDTETNGLGTRRAELCGVSLSCEAGTGAYVPVRSPTPEEHLDTATVLGTLRPILEDPTKPKVGQNLKFDTIALRHQGVHLRGLVVPDSEETGFDSMIASYLIDASRSSHSLDALSQALLAMAPTPLKDLIGSGAKEKRFEQVPLDRAAPYGAQDADLPLRLRDRMQPQLTEMGLVPLFRDVELPLVEVLAEMEWNGILVDRGELDRQRERLEGQVKVLREQIDEAAYHSVGRTFNPDSPKQLAGVLFAKPGDPEPGIGIKPVKKTKTGYSTDIEVLEKLAADATIESPIPELVVEYRKLTKLVGTYLASLVEDINPQTGRIHASFNQTVAATGRLSSSDPNLQNIPIRTDVGREIRRAFVAPPGHRLISADYSQIELRLLAHLADDPALKTAFERGQDIHTAVAAQIHAIDVADVTPEQRAGAKMVNFGIVYGITPFGLARRLAISNGEAADIIDGYKRRFAGITTFLQECIEQATRHGYVETMLKRRRPIPDITATNPAHRSLAERMAINSVVQGSAADLIKLAMVELHRKLAPTAAHLRGDKPPLLDGVLMILQIHDELVFEAPEAIAEDARVIIVESMESAMDLSVPLVVDSAIARDWFEGK